VSEVRVALHAALDPQASGGVQTNLVSLVVGLKQSGRSSHATLLSPPALVERWRAVAAPEISVASWSHSFPWYRGGENDEVLGRRLAEDLCSTAADVRRRDREIKATGSQVVHFPYQVAFDSELPTVYEPWDLQHVRIPQVFTPGERIWRTALFERACQRAVVVVTATEETKKDLCAVYGVDEDKIAVIYRDAKELPAPRRVDEAADLRRRFGINGEFAFYPAASYAHKNHAQLIEAAAILRDRHRVKLTIVCSGKRQAATWPDLSARLERLGLRDCVRFVGVVTEEDLAALYRAARLVIFPSLFEGLGLPLLEAMQCGTPIAAARASCIPEVVGDAAALFDPLQPEDIAATTAALWDDDARRCRLVERGAVRRLDFAWGKAALAFEKAYSRAAAQF